MRELVNRIIWHKVYGEGIIEKQEIVGKNNYVWVRFLRNDSEESLMKFQYPEAFCAFLTLAENDLQKEVLEELESKKKALLEKKSKETEAR